MTDRLAAAALMALCLALLALLPAWRADQPPPAYEMPPDQFRARVDAYAAAADAPEDIYLLAEPFRFWPPPRLLPDKTYRLHLGSVDGVHAVAVAGREVLLVPGQIWTFEIDSPPSLRCNEYCGLGHSRMRLDPMPAASAPRSEK